MRRAVPLLVVVLVSTARAATYTLATAGGDFTSIQAALNTTVAGDTVQVRDTGSPWFEKVAFSRSGNAVDGPIVLTAYPGEHPILDGTGVPGDDMVHIEDRSWITVSGLELRNNLGLHGGSGIRVLGAGSHVTLRDNVIHYMRGANAMAITVFATEPRASGTLS